MTTYHRGWMVLAGAVLAGLLLTGCAQDYNDFGAFLKKPRPVVGGKPYVIEPPDTVRILCPNVPEIDGRQATLRPDGMITMPLLGDIFCAGKTPTQLASEVELKALGFYEDPKVQIEVVGFNSKVYYMAGETAIGPKPYTGKDTVLDAVLRAGIPRTAWPSHVVVLRPNEEGELIRRMSVNMRDMYEIGNVKLNAVLEEGDIVFMPTNPVARVGIFFQNLLFPVSPALQAAQTPAAFSGVGLSRP